MHCGKLEAESTVNQRVFARAVILGFGCTDEALRGDLLLLIYYTTQALECLGDDNSAHYSM
jgi:hypothetical protein